MDGRGRAVNKAFVERLWRSVKFEDPHLREYPDGHVLHSALARYFHFYDHERPHSPPDYRFPASCHRSH